MGNGMLSRRSRRCWSRVRKRNLRRRRSLIGSPGERRAPDLNCQRTPGSRVLTMAGE
jgi:hypothetical protein